MDQKQFVQYYRPLIRQYSERFGSVPHQNEYALSRDAFLEALLTCLQVGKPMDSLYTKVRLIVDGERE